MGAPSPPCRARSAPRRSRSSTSPCLQSPCPELRRSVPLPVPSCRPSLHHRYRFSLTRVSPTVPPCTSCSTALPPSVFPATTVTVSARRARGRPLLAPAPPPLLDSCKLPPRLPTTITRPLCAPSVCAASPSGSRPVVPPRLCLQTACPAASCALPPPRQDHRRHDRIPFGPKSVVHKVYLSNSLNP